MSSVGKARAPQVRYRVFARDTHKKRSFEPSGIAAWPGKDTFVVVDDKTDKRALVVFRLTKNHKLEQERAVRVRDDDGKIDINKLEDIVASRKTPGKFYVTSAQPGVETGRLLSLRLAHNGKVNGVQELSFNAGREARRLLGSQARVAQTEALALSPDEKHLYVGLRSVAAHHGAAEQYRVIILECDPSLSKRAPRLLVNVDITSVVGRPEGISSLTYAPALGGYLLLTSYEGPGETKRDVGGHLWFVKDLATLDDLATWSTLPHLELAHKPEGVSMTRDGQIIVVYDDDEERKDRHRADKFALRKRESVYSIIAPAALGLPQV